MNPRRRWIAGFALFVLAGAAPDLGDSPLTLADLEGYRQALADPSSGLAPAVGFRDLWDRPHEYLGHRVRVSGRAARMFRQSSLGAFPSLVEAWVVTPAGDPLCLVFPDREGASVPRMGETVTFVGTYRKRLRYRGGDVERLAPLLVGPNPPERVEQAAPAGFVGPGSGADAAMGLAVAAGVALILARRHLARPVRRPNVPGPDPSFVDGGERPRLEFLDGPEARR